LQHGKKRLGTYAPIACVCGFVFLVVLGCSRNHASSFERDKRVGDNIVEALDTYRADNSHYPRQLTDLVPKYLPEIPPPQYGDGKWDYNYKPDNDSFGLYVWGKKSYQDGYLYSSNRRMWEKVENSF
jgi:hypothetical protein